MRKHPKHSFITSSFGQNRIDLTSKSGEVTLICGVFFNPRQNIHVNCIVQIVYICNFFGKLVAIFSLLQRILVISFYFDCFVPPFQQVCLLKRYIVSQETSRSNKKVKSNCKIILLFCMDSFPQSMSHSIILTVFWYLFM